MSHSCARRVSSLFDSNKAILLTDIDPFWRIGLSETTLDGVGLVNLGYQVWGKRAQSTQLGVGRCLSGKLQLDNLFFYCSPPSFDILV